MKSFVKLLILCILPIILISINACEDPSTEPGPPVVNPPQEQTVAQLRAEMIVHIANNIIIPSYERSQASVNDMLTAISAFNALPNELNLLNAQQALKQAWLDWQAASIYLFGPAETVSLQSSLSTYPTDTDKIESNAKVDSYNLESLGNKAAVGFPALDYLLHGEGDSDVIFSFTSGENTQNRKAYLDALATTIKGKLDEVISAWNTSYVMAFTSADAAGTDVGSALGLLVNSMDLHFQRFVRDGKVAIPAGIRSAGIPRPIAIEARYGEYSVELLVESLRAYHNLFLGIDLQEVDGTSLYDYLQKIDETGLADDIKSQYLAAITSAKTLTDPLDDQIDTDLEKLNTVFLELQKVVVFIKSDAASIMGISITNQDNDGD